MLYLISATTDDDTYFATIQFYFCFTNLYAIATRAVNRIMNTQILICAAIGVMGCMIGDFIGKFVFNKLDSNDNKRNDNAN